MDILVILKMIIFYSGIWVANNKSRKKQGTRTSGCKNFFKQNFFGQKIFFDQNFLTKNVFDQKSLSTKFCFRPKFLWDLKF